MKKTLNQKIRKVCKPLFLGIFLSGAMLMPSMGFFSQTPLYRSLFAANINTPIQTDTTVSFNISGGEYFGIYQSGDSIETAQITFENQTKGVIGSLDTSITGLTGVQGKSLALSGTSTLTIGSGSTETEYGTLYIAGSDTASILTINSGASLVLNPYSQVNVGYAENGSSYSGQLVINQDYTIEQDHVTINVNPKGSMTVNGDLIIGQTGTNTTINVESGTLVCNNLKDYNWGSSADYGKLVNSEGTITVNNYLTWYSTLTNNGTITINGAVSTDPDSLSTVYNYTDDADAVLAAAGNLLMTYNSYVINGSIYAGDTTGNTDLTNNTGTLTVKGALSSAAGSKIVAGTMDLYSANDVATGIAQFSGSVYTNNMTNSGKITFGASNAVATTINVNNLIHSQNYTFTESSTTTNYGGSVYIYGTTANNATVTAGGIQVDSYTDTTDNSVEGGNLELSTNATLEISGLNDKKFDANGNTGSGDGYNYDIYLGGILTAGSKSTITFKDDIGGIVLGSNVSVTTSSSTTTTTVTGSTVTGTVTGKTLYLSGAGIYNSEKAVYDLTVASGGIINADNNLVLNSRVSSTTNTMGIQNIGTIKAAENLTFEGTNIYLLNGNGKTAATMTIGTFDSTADNFGGGQIVTAAGSTTNIGTLTLDDSVSLKLGTITTDQKTSGGVLEIENATVKSGGVITISGGGKLITSANAENKNGSLTVENGGNIELTVENKDSTTAVIGGVSTNSTTMNVNIQNGGKISTGSTSVEGTSYANTLTMQYAEIANEGSITAQNAVSIAQSTYSGNGQINSASVTLSAGSTLEASLNNTLNLTSTSNGAKFATADNSSISVEFGTDSNSPSVLDFANTASGTVTLAAGSVVEASNINDLNIGTYTRVLIDESSAASSYDEATYEKTAFQSIEKSAYGDNNGVLLTLNVEARTFSELASIYGHTNNLINMGNYIDSFEDSDKASEDLSDLITDIRELGTKAEVFDAMTQMSGVNKANSLAMAMDTPWIAAFDQMGYETHGPAADNYEVGPAYLGQMSYDGYYDNTNPNGLVGSMFGTNSDYQRYSFWGVAQHTTMNADSDGNSAAYGISNTGMTIGRDWLNSEGTVAGLAFHFNLPFLYGQNQRIEMNNYHLGFYAGKKNYAGTGVKFYIDYGIQHYTSKRSVEIGDFSDLYNTDFDGQSFAACLQLSHDMSLNCCTVLRPLIQLDSQFVWQNDAKESEGTAALNYDKADWNQTFLRLGCESEFNTRFYRFTSRAIYGCLLNGETAPEMAASFSNVSGGSNFMIQGVDVGSAFGDLGIGALGYFDCEHKWSISGNYDFTFSENTQAHTGAVSISRFF